MSIITIKPTDNIFFLDDDINRIWEFKGMLAAIGIGQNRLWIAENVDSAKIILSDSAMSEPFNIYFLDHDLIEEHYGDLVKSASNTKGTGQEVAQMIKPTKDAWFVIHTMNPYGSLKIYDILAREKGVKSDKITKVPFGHFQLEKKL